MQSNNAYSGICIDCHKTSTTSKWEDQFVCASCCNTRYYDDLTNGKIKELRIRVSEYKQGTIEQIYAILATNKLTQITHE